MPFTKWVTLTLASSFVNGNSLYDPGDPGAENALLRHKETYLTHVTQHLEPPVQKANKGLEATQV